MLKKLSVITTVSTALIVGGGLSSVEASVSTSNSTNPSYTIHHVGQKENQNTNFQQTSNDNSDHPFYFNRMNGNDQQNGDKDDHVFDEKDNGGKQKPSQDEEQTKDKSKHNQQSEKKQEKPSKDDETNNEKQESDKQDKQTKQKAEGLSEYEQEVVDLTNKERKKQGLSPLKADKELGEVAHEKSDDMSTNDYFSHDSPTYGSPFDMLESYDVSYQTAGENIARGQQSPEKVVEGWMNSEGHRENILNEDFSHIGVGYVEDGDYWTQEFTG